MNHGLRGISIGLMLALSAATLTAAVPPPAPGCPLDGWSEGLGAYLEPGAAFPTQDTPTDAPDCNFHEWSWEAFVWATALDGQGLPRFMSLPTEEDLLSADPHAATLRPRQLKLAARSLMAHGTPGYTEGAGAFVEADGNILIAPNGYPVYASIHMNPSYFATAKKNLILTGGYNTQPADSSFDVGAAVFKATWLRLDGQQTAPAGTFTTQAQVPVLTVVQTKSTITIQPVPGQFQTVTVALLGLHVVGHTINHPEFLWGTFEHRLNSPRTPDNTFSTQGSNPHNYTLYQANTPFKEVNQPELPPTLKFDVSTQRFTPITNAVLENQTGGENQPHGPGNIFELNAQSQSFLEGLQSPQSLFANYDLIGTVWMKPNT